MAIAVTSIIERNIPLGRKKGHLVEFTLSGTYATGGQLTNGLRALGLDYRCDAILPESAEGLGVKGVYGTNPLVRLFRTDQIDDPQEEVPNGTAISGTFRALVIGR